MHRAAINFFIRLTNDGATSSAVEINIRCAASSEFASGAARYVDVPAEAFVFLFRPSADFV